MMLKSGKTTIAILLVAVLALAIGLVTQQSLKRSSDASKMPPEFTKLILLPTPRTLGEVDFLDHTGKRFTLENFRGHWSILFFGFTHCPDICPATMHVLKQVKQQLSLAGRWGNHQVVMVSVDPARDTPQQLANYVPFFDPEFIGLSGSLETTTEFASKLGILFVAHEARDNGSYDVDHGTSLVLLNPQGQMAGVITAPHKIAEITADLIALADYYAADHQLTTAAGISDVPAQTGAPQSSGIDQASSTSDELRLENAWIRPAPTGATSLVAYFELVNDADTTARLTGAESPDFEASMIHTTVVEEGMARMQHRDELLIPANGRVSFAPLATHLMLMQPKSPLPPGTKVEITLNFDGGRSLTQLIEVRPQPD